jgi:hypothetical protein
MLRASGVWLGILVLASANGAIRDLLLAPRLGDTIARAISTVALCAIIFVVARLTIDWIHPTTRREAYLIGVWWLALTLAFEFLAGHYAMQKPWADLLADYDVTLGRIWILVLFVTLIAPLWMARRRGLVID